MASIITKSASRAKHKVCSGERTMRFCKKAVHKAHRSRIKRDLHVISVDYNEDDECTIEPLRRSEMCTNWEIH